MEPTAFTVIVIALCIGFISATCPNNSWLVAEKVTNMNQNYSGTGVCIKGFSTPKSWPEASSTCRMFHGNLVSFDKDYRYRSGGYVAFPYQEFWTGMYVTTDRYKVPLLDGVPPQRVNETYYNRNSKTWQWATREPNVDRGCQIMTNGPVNHTAYLVPCNQRLPFYCVAPNTFPIATSLCLNGSLSAGLCYTVFRRPMTYDDAVSHCRQEGGSVATFDGDNKEILAEALFLDGSFTEADIQSYYINGTSVVGNTPESDSVDPLCYTLNMGDANIEELPCTTPIGVICEKPLTVPPSQGGDIPVFQVFKSSGNSNIYRMQCGSKRKLMDFEKMVTFHDGVPEDSNYIQSNGTMTEITRSGSDYKAIGDYWCEIQNTRTSERLMSNKVRYEFPRSWSLTYRGYANFTVQLQNLNISLHNLGFLQDTRYLQSSSFIIGLLGTSINNAVRDITLYQEAPLYFKPEIVSGYYGINKISEYGESVAFSVYFKVNDWNMDVGSQWFTTAKDQFAMNKLTEGIKNNIISGSVPSRRSKRQIGPLLPDVVISSTGSCSAFTVYDLDLERSISFGAVVAGNTAFSTEICITDKRPLANVTCLRSFYQGASYGEIKINQRCVFTNTSGSSSTTTLQRLAETNVTNTTEILADTYNLTLVDDLTSLDVIYTASILTNVAESTDEFDQKNVEYAADIVNRIIGLNGDILVQAQDAGSGTTRLVEALETITNNIVLDDTHSASIIRPFVASEIREFSSDTNLVVGLQLLDSPEVTITNSSLKILEDEMNLDILVTDAAIVLPKSLLQSANTTRLLLQIYSSTKLFKTRSSDKRLVAHGPIAAATLTQDQKRILNLGQEQVKTVFRPFKQTEGLVCGYWDYDKNDNSGGWSTDGCRLESQEDNRAICVCNHLTNFAILIDFEAQGNYVEAHQLALSIITIVGLVLSIIGLSFTIICFLIFKPLRKTRGQKVLFQLAVAMLCSWVVFLAGVEQTSDYNGCIAVAILLHYFILVTFMWLLVEGLLQYLRFVKVLGTYIPRFMLKASIFAWGVPLIPVIAVCAIDYRLYDGGIHYCWMSLQPFYYAFALPVGLVILTNIIVFILVIVNIVRRPAGLQSNQSERKRALMNFWAALSIFVLLGVTWIFGYMAIEDARIPFQYIFTICNAFQGFYIFLLFVTRNPQVRREWTAMCCKKEKKDLTGYDSSAGSKSKDSTAFSDLSAGKKTSLT